MLRWFSRRSESDRVSAQPRSAAIAAMREARLRAAIDRAPVGLGVSSLDGQWVWFNKACSTILGYKHEELTRITLPAMTHADDAKRETKLLQDLMHGDLPHYRIRKRVMDKRGGYRTIVCSTALVQLNPGEPWLLVHSIQAGAIDGDTAHDADRLSTVILNKLAHTAVIRTDNRGIITGWNAGAAALLGYRAEEMTGRNRATLYRDEDNWIDHPDQHLREAQQTGSCERDDWRIRADGTHVWVSSMITPFAPDGTVRGYIEVLTPAAQRDGVDAADELRRLREENRRLTEQVRHLKTAEALHLRELRIFVAALKKERTERKEPDAPQWERLGDRNLLDLIAECEREERSGLLAISDEHEHRGIFFDRGRIVATASSDEEASLGQRLVRARWITEAERCKALETSEQTGLPFGRALLVQGFLDESLIATAIRQKIVDDIRGTSAWADAQWSFIDKTDLPLKLVEVRVSTADLGASREEERQRFLASAGAAKYHLATCLSSARIAARSRVTFDSAEEAAAAGYTPCHRCLRGSEARGPRALASLAG